MEKTNMSETLGENFNQRKKTLLRNENARVSASIDAVRDPQNPVKLRAENRARELGTTLGDIYKRTGVSRNYLTYYPKSGWREDRVRLVATALQWTVDDLLHGPQHTRENEQRERERAQQNNNLLELAIELAVGLLREGRPAGTSDPPTVGRLSRMIYEDLQAHVESGEQLPSEQFLRIYGRRLITALTTRSTDS
jgi:hypothetical protein